MNCRSHQHTKLAKHEKERTDGIETIERKEKSERIQRIDRRRIDGLGMDHFLVKSTQTQPWVWVERKPSCTLFLLLSSHLSRLDYNPPFVQLHSLGEIHKTVVSFLYSYTHVYMGMSVFTIFSHPALIACFQLAITFSPTVSTWRTYLYLSIYTLQSLPTLVFCQGTPFVTCQVKSFL